MKIRFYQKDEFDMVTPLYYELVNVNDSVIVKRRFLIGTHRPLNNSNELNSEIRNDTLLIFYPSNEQVLAKAMADFRQ